MDPGSFERIPAALALSGVGERLGHPLDLFRTTSDWDPYLDHVLRFVARTLGLKCVGDLCSAEVESLIVRNYSAEIAARVRRNLWRWLIPDGLGAEYDEDYDDDGMDAPRRKRDKPPAIDDPPSDLPEIEHWCERHGVRGRLDDRIKFTSVPGYYASPPEGLPTTIRDALCVTAEKIPVPSYSSRKIAEYCVASARTYLHRVAQALALGNRQRGERAARSRPPENPSVQRLVALLRRTRDEVVTGTPRAPGTFLPGEVEVHSDPPVLTYHEWHVSDGHPPAAGIDKSVFFVHLVGWESGQLSFECTRCGESSGCPHAESVFVHVIDLLHDPADPLAGELAQVLGVPGWSRFLDQLDTGLSPLKDDERESRRLVWELVRQPRETALVPVLQKPGKSGTWSRGERKKLDALEYKPGLLRDPMDRAAYEALRYSRDGHYSGLNDQTPRQVWRGLAALIGSSRVFAEPSRSVPYTVGKARLALRVDPNEAGFRLRLTLGTCDVDPAGVLEEAKDGRHVVWVDAAHHRCLLALLEPEMKALLTAMAKYPVVLPLEALGELVGRLPRFQHAMDIHLPDEVRGERIDPPPRIVCRLEPLPDSGVRIDMVVRPIEDGPVFVPGEGPPEVLHVREGRRVHAIRTLGAERERAAHLSHVLGLDDTAASGAFRWDIVDDGAALDLLGKLRGASGLAEMEWPEGEIRVDGVGCGALKVQVRKRHDWFGANGGVEIDGARIPLSDLLAATRAGRRYVKLTDKRFAVIEDELLARLSALDDMVFDSHGAVEFGVPAVKAVADLVQDSRQLDVVPAFSAVLSSIEESRGLDVALPAGMRATLRHYQEDGYRWLARLAAWGLGACLADDMGLGKTLQALALLVRRADLGPALVIAPTSVVANWDAECAKFAPTLNVRVYRGSGRAPLLDGLGKGSLLITSYAIAVRDADVLKEMRFSTLVIDEAQSVKNALTHRFRAIRDLQADFRVALTGTPIENHLGELWAILRLATPGLLGSWDQFRGRFAVPIERHRDPARRKALANVIRPFLLRRTKAEVAPELPARTEMNRIIELGPIERRLYEAARVEILESLAASAAAGTGDDARQRIKILAMITRLRLLCCHPRLVDKGSAAASSKLKALVELLIELRDEGHRALVFSQFTSFLDLARPLLAEAGLRTVTLDGSTPAAEREERVRAFQAGGADAFLLSLRAGGTGLNLTAATYVIHLDPWWNPAVEDQATDRAHRIGQDRPVTVIRMVARGTIEEAVLSLHEEKRQLAAGILDGTDVAARLDSDDLLNLIRRGGGDTDGDDGDDEDIAPA